MPRWNCYVSTIHSMHRYLSACSNSGGRCSNIHAFTEDKRAINEEAPYVRLPIFWFQVSRSQQSLWRVQGHRGHRLKRWDRIYYSLKYNLLATWYRSRWLITTHMGTSYDDRGWVRCASLEPFIQWHDNYLWEGWEIELHACGPLDGRCHAVLFT